MSLIVARMEKMKQANLVGIGKHNQRKTDNHTNKQIDVTRSHLNYDLVEGRTENYKTDIEKYIIANKSTTRAVRKDAVVVCEWVISSDRGFFEKLSEDETRRYFEVAKDYFAENFGEENIRYGHVHVDETTPHMHLGVVPFDKDMKLAAKNVFNRATLQRIQKELPERMKEHGFDIERGSKNSERKNLSVPEFKKMKDEMATLEDKFEERKTIFDNLELKHAENVKAEKAIEQSKSNLLQQKKAYEDELRKQQAEVEANRNMALQAIAERKKEQEEHEKKLKERETSLQARERDVSDFEDKHVELIEKFLKAYKSVKMGLKTIVAKYIRLGIEENKETITIHNETLRKRVADEYTVSVDNLEKDEMKSVVNSYATAPYIGMSEEQKTVSALQEKQQAIIAKKDQRTAKQKADDDFVYNDENLDDIIAKAEQNILRDALKNKGNAGKQKGGHDLSR